MVHELRINDDEGAATFSNIKFRLPLWLTITLEAVCNADYNHLVRMELYDLVLL